MVRRVRLRNIIIHRYLDIVVELLIIYVQKLIGLTREYRIIFHIDKKNNLVYVTHLGKRK